MFGRLLVLLLTLPLWPAAASAQELNPEQSRLFVQGKLFSYTCFDGSAGEGTIRADGSVNGNVRLGGSGRTLFATLPPGTIRVDGSEVCAHLAGLPMTPCFKVEATDSKSFRGSLRGLPFAYCDFHQIESHAASQSQPRRDGAAHLKPAALRAPQPSALY